ncbi:uncharacterized protein LOC112529352 isoform X2 [Cynara cardunculus var. scolymus]|uniref:uncharacterized protein LOC112529352 isoform X2 n=1 Tax=Cynara cardunculus var. scolymus TaxID=59895 RepID=UPI000D62947E|nr:uncharacterized protein LOC112529352 isoform X2 [Cynara cardunculus var. scolymus]
MEEHRHDGVQEEKPSLLEMSTFQLKHCIESLLRFTLALSIEESIDIGLSKEFCSNLLEEDEEDRTYSHTYPSSTSSTGVPPYPLYKHLASALCKSIPAGRIHPMSADMSLIHEDSSSKQQKCEWNKIIQEKGSDLIKMLETVQFELHVQEPFFSQLKDGQKTIEGRCADGDYNRIESGSSILFNKCLLLQVQDVHRYASFSDMLAAEDLANVLPGVETVKEGTQIYRRFYSEEKERSKGVLAILLTEPALQPYDHLGAILSALHYDGVQRLLGIAHTIGTIPDALPLPRSTLLHSFSLPHNPDICFLFFFWKPVVFSKTTSLSLGIEVRSAYTPLPRVRQAGRHYLWVGYNGFVWFTFVYFFSSVLNIGARALAKHVNRSNGKFWGSFAGSEPQKNMLAFKVISNLIAHCCWLNVHIVPPHGAIFEIRVQDGYGARWSLKPTKFIGFLEPYTKDGYMKGWKH